LIEEQITCELDIQLADPRWCTGQGARMHETARLHQSGVYGNHHTQSRYPSLYTPYAASSRVRIPTRALSHSGHGTSSSFASSVRPAHMPFTSGPGIWERYPPQLTAQYRPYAPSNLVLIVADGSRPDVVAQVRTSRAHLARKTSLGTRVSSLLSFLALRTGARCGFTPRRSQASTCNRSV
jgi:hypothetical protein